MDEPDTPGQLKARALRYLVRREHSRSELARKLAPRAQSREVLDAVLDELAARKQLSDERYAEGRARSLARKYGSAKIRHDLRSKGISDDVVGRISSEGELERARAVLGRKYRDPAGSAQERARRARFLQGRGFSMDVITRLIF
ncbi:MAG TPA: recombination regulator RecX [Burkholderiales bacterium]|jgi:regulatory protein